MVQFERDFFNGEIRNGFYIDDMMKNAWAAQLEVLCKFDAICSKYQIPYFADWGTLLGAVRHHGFIPWDDDIDICMMRKDIERLYEILDSGAYDLKYMNIYNTPSWGAHAVKIINTDTFFMPRRQFMKEYHGFPFTAGMDVFIIDYVPRDYNLEQEQYEVLNYISDICQLKRELKDYSPISSQYAKGVAMLHDLLEKIKKICNIDFSEDNPTEQELYILYEEVSGLYGNEDADYLTQVGCLKIGMDYYLDKETYKESIRVPFENITIPIPKGYHDILRKKYGENYMTPLHGKAGHNYPFYGRLLEKISDINYGGDREQAESYVKKISSGYYKKFLSKSAVPTLKYEELNYNNHLVNDMIMQRNLAAQTEVLEEVKRICEKYKIKFWAIKDTLDSIVNKKKIKSNMLDIGMERADYIQFVNVIQEELDPWFDYSNIYSNKQHSDLTCHITSDGYMCDQEEFLKRFHGCNDTVGIQVFSFDCLEEDEEQVNAREMLVKGLIKTAESVGIQPPYSNEVAMIIVNWERVLNMEFDQEDNLKNQLFKAADRISNADCENSQNVWIPADLQQNRMTIYNIDSIKKTIDVPIGETTIPIPSGYSNMLIG